MMRRALLTAGTVGGLVGALAAPEAGEAAQTSAEIVAMDRVAQAIAHLRDELREQRQFTEIAALRAAQKQFLRQNGKLPDFVDVGADVWFQAYDWHVRWQQPLVEGRDPLGRLTLTMAQTAVVLRPDVSATYIGLPYDAR